jgi:hypothetical protein
MLYRVSSVYINTEQVFALASLLGFRFAPRISDALSKKLYLLDTVGASAPLDTLLFDLANTKLIIQQWDEMRRVASSIRHGTVSASLLMRKLAAYPRQNQVARALTELGKLERTAFLLGTFVTNRSAAVFSLGSTKGKHCTRSPANSSLVAWGNCAIALWKIKSIEPVVCICSWLPLPPGTPSISQKPSLRCASEVKRSQKRPWHILHHLGGNTFA